MGLRLASARTVSTVSTAALKYLFRRPAANFPGKIALYIDPHLIRDLSKNLNDGSIVVCGTNGKTTITNLLADVLEQSGKSVACNRTGANLDSGVATALLHAGKVDWGIFECDELWLSKVLPALQSRYLLLLNLFSDQIDRVGEIDRIQGSIAAALTKSPDTVLIYNADDPMCARIADSVDNKSITFGVGEDMKLTLGSTAEKLECQKCAGALEYEYRQYDQLGAFACSNCDFERPSLDFVAKDVLLTKTETSFTASWNGASAKISAPLQGAYMVYNLLATYVAAHEMGCSETDFKNALNNFDPKNGRLQWFNIAGRPILMNLAKNPAGFNQNISLILQDEGPKAVAFYVNNKEGDGRDPSWINDVDFEALADESTKIKMIGAGGSCASELMTRLEKAQLSAELVGDARDLLAKGANLPADHTLYVIANYTALPPLHADFTAMAETQE